MNLTKRELGIIEEFKQKLNQKNPGAILEVIIYGSKARDDAREDSDIDLLVITKNEDRRLTKEIRDIGYELELENDVTLSIQIFSENYMDYIRSIETQFIRNVDDQGIRV